MLPNNETVNQKANLDSQSLPKLENLPIKDAEIQTPANFVVEDSTQTKEEFEKQISSQLGPEEVKQVQIEGQLSISPQKKSGIYGKLIFKDSPSHC